MLNSCLFQFTIAQKNRLNSKSNRFFNKLRDTIKYK